IDAEIIGWVWYLLRPMKSEIVPVGKYIVQVLGYKPEAINKRDAYKFERELAAGRDGCGYGFMPLGQFAKAMIDLRRFGPGVHESMTYVHPSDPTPYHEKDWAAHPVLADETWKDPD